MIEVTRRFPSFVDVYESERVPFHVKNLKELLEIPFLKSLMDIEANYVDKIDLLSGKVVDRPEFPVFHRFSLTRERKDGRNLLMAEFDGGVTKYCVAYLNQDLAELPETIWDEESL